MPQYVAIATSWFGCYKILVSLSYVVVGNTRISWALGTADGPRLANESTPTNDIRDPLSLLSSPNSRCWCLKRGRGNASAHDTHHW